MSFALEAMEPEEREEYRQHLQSCDVCVSLVGEYQAVSELLPGSAPDMSPSPDLWSRIESEARLDIEESPAPVPQPQPSWLDMLFGRFRLATAGVAVVLLVGLVAWNVVLQVDSGDLTKISLPEAMVQAIAQGGTVSRLAGTDDAPSASGVVVQQTGGTEALVYLSDLPTLPSDRVFQAWSISAGTPASAGTFEPPSEDGAVVSLAYDFSAAEAIGISIEPTGGSPSPTGSIVLLSAP